MHACHIILQLCHDPYVTRYVTIEVSNRAAKIDFLSGPILTFIALNSILNSILHIHQAGYYDPPITREKHENGI